MWYLFGWAALGTGFTFAMTALGAATVFFLGTEPNPRGQKAMLGFAGGVMTAASIWSLLIPAMEQAEREGRVPGWLPAALGILLGTLFLAALDSLLPFLRTLWPLSLTLKNTTQPGSELSGPGPVRMTHDSPESVRTATDSPKSVRNWRQTTLLMAAITLHNIPEGIAVGLACALASDGNGAAGAVALAVGIGIQNFPEGAAVSLPLGQAGFSRRTAFLGGALSGAVEPLFGLLAAAAAASVYSLMPGLLSFAAGAMLYVVVEELIPQAHSRAGTCGFLAGFLLMMVLDAAF